MQKRDLGPLPLDAKDILLDRDLEDMPPIAVRGYLYLLCEQWENGPLTPTLQGLASVARVTPTIFKRQVWPHILGYFEKTTVNSQEKLIEPVSYSDRLAAIKRVIKREELTNKQRKLWAKKKS